MTRPLPMQALPRGKRTSARRQWSNHGSWSANLYNATRLLTVPSANSPQPHDQMPTQLDLGLGALQVGVGLCCFLVGIVTLQTLNYFRNFDKDPWPIKLLVATVYIFDLIHSAFLMHTLYEYGITFYGHPERMAMSVWSLNTSIIFQGLVALCVQSFFCLRILRISGSWILTGICLSLCLARFCMSMTVVSFDFKYYSFAIIETRYQTFTACALGVIAASDVSIAACMVGALVRQKTGFASTNKLIDKIIGFVVATGLLTSILAVIDVITFVTMHNFIWLAVLVIIVKVYTNSLLASLNERIANRASELSFSTSMTRPSKIEWRAGRTPGQSTLNDARDSGGDQSSYELSDGRPTLKGTLDGAQKTSYTSYTDHAV